MTRQKQKMKRRILYIVPNDKGRQGRGWTERERERSVLGARGTLINRSAIHVEIAIYTRTCTSFLQSLLLKTMRKCFSTCARSLSHENPLVRGIARLPQVSKQENCTRLNNSLTSDASVAGSSSQTCTKQQGTASHHPTGSTRSAPEAASPPYHAHHRCLLREGRGRQIHVGCEPSPLLLAAWLAHRDSGHRHLRSFSPYSARALRCR